MARRSEATREAVWDAMERLRSAGDPRWDSPMRLRIAIGSVGSFSTITQHRDAWREAHKSHTPILEARCEVPPEARDAASDAIAKAVEQAWRTAKDHAAAAAEDIRRKANADVTAANRDRDDALEEARRLEHELAEAEAALKEQRERSIRAEQLGAELAATNKSLQYQIEQALVVVREQQEATIKSLDQASFREQALASDLDREAQRAAELGAKLAKVNSQLVDVEANYTEQTNRLIELQQTLMTTQADASEWRAKGSSVEKDLKRINSENYELKQQINQLTERMTALSAEIIRVSERAEIMEQERQTADRKAAHASEMIHKLEAKIDVLVRSEALFKRQLEDERERGSRQEAHLGKFVASLATIAERS